MNSMKLATLAILLLLTGFALGRLSVSTTEQTIGTSSGTDTQIHKSSADKPSRAVPGIIQAPPTAESDLPTQKRKNNTRSDNVKAGEDAADPEPRDEGRTNSKNHPAPAKRTDEASRENEHDGDRKDAEEKWDEESKDRQEQAIRDVIRSIVPGVKSCYETNLAEHPDLAGKIVVQVTLINHGGTGYIKAIEIAEDSIMQPQMMSCMVESIARLQFDLSETKEGEELVVKYPFVFSRR